MTTTEKLMTAEEFLALPETDGTRAELIDGRVVELPGTNALHAVVSNQFGRHLGNHVAEHHLGYVLNGDPGILLARNPDRIRCPDVCFIAADRLPDGPPSHYLDRVPDLIVEIVSPSDSASEVRKKTDEWLRAGARLVVVIYPESRVIVTETPETAARFREGDVLTGAPVLPDFRLPLAELFAW